MANDERGLTKKEQQTHLQRIVQSAAVLLPSHMTPERMLKLVYAAATRQPKLFQCLETEQGLASVGMCLTACSELGLEPGAERGHVYLIPRENRKGRYPFMECTLQIGYKGYAELGRRAGVQVDGSVVYVGEPFMSSRTGGPPIGEIVKYAGDLVLEHPKLLATYQREGIWHQWSDDVDRSDAKIRAAWAAVWVDGRQVFEVLTKREIDARRARSQSGNNGPWVTDYARMARKTAIRSLFAGGLVPMSAEIVRALEIDHDDDVDLTSPTNQKSITGNAAASLMLMAQNAVTASRDDDAPDADREQAESNGAPSDPLAAFDADLASCKTADAVFALQAQWIERDESLTGDIKALAATRLKALSNPT